MNRSLKQWCQTDQGALLPAEVVVYADDLVIVSRGHGAEARAWVEMTINQLGLTLNEAKTRICDACAVRFDFLGYRFGPPDFRKDGRGYLGARLSKKRVAGLQGQIGAAHAGRSGSLA